MSPEDQDAQRVVQEWLSAAVRELYPDRYVHHPGEPKSWPIVRFNDAPETRKGEVLRVFEHALKMYRAARARQSVPAETAVS